MLRWFRNYLVIVASGKKVQTVTIVDMVNKFVAFSAGFNDVTHVNSEWGALNIITGDGKVCWIGRLVVRLFVLLVACLFVFRSANAYHYPLSPSRLSSPLT